MSNTTIGQPEAHTLMVIAKLSNLPTPQFQKPVTDKI
uniref:Uncharacterized protein n=1 Tax=Arundo donax TaxID=35708 RepID=A0A0A9B6F6_ARUDO